MTGKRIVVVGAGIAGLTAAYYLTQAGYKPIVLEKSNRVGGRMITDVIDGFTIDCGAQFLMDSYPILTSLINRNGLDVNYIHTNQYIGTIRDREIRKSLRSDVLSPLKSGILSFPGWLRFILGSIPLIVQDRSRPMNDFTAWTQYDDTNADNWCKSHFGQEVTDYMVEPIFDGLFFQPMNVLSRAFVRSILSTFLYRKVKNMTTLTGGLGILSECLASQFEVRLNTPVTSMSISRNGIELEAGGELLSTDRVILATPASISKALFLSPNNVEHDLLATPYSTSIVVAIAMRDSFSLDPAIGDIYGVLVPKKERSVIATIGIEASKDKLRLAGGHLLIVFLSGEAGKEMLDWTDSAILPPVIKELDRYFPGFSGNIRFTRIYRWKDAMPLSPIGRSRNIARYRATITESAKVFLAGDYMGMPFTEGAAETGKWAAECLMKNPA